MALPGYGGPPHNSRAPTDINEPRPVGFDDRSNFLHYLDELQPQFIWSGNTLVNTRLLVIDPDIPNEQARTIVVGPDPVPLKDPRPGYWASQEAASGVPPLPPFVTEET